MLIRPATLADRQGIADVILPIQQEEFGIAITYEEQPDLTNIAGFYQNDGGEFWVAEINGRIIGTIALKDIGHHEGALRKMFVAPDFRGREKGIAQGLLDHLLQHARTQKFKAIYLGTTAQFLAAHKFYEKNGFALANEADLPDRFPRMSVDTRFYKIKL